MTYTPQSNSSQSAFFLNILEMEEYRDAIERVYGKLRNVIDDDDAMNEEYKRKLERDLDTVQDSTSHSLPKGSRMDEKTLDELMSLSLEERWMELLDDVDELIQLEEDRLNGV